MKIRLSFILLVSFFFSDAQYLKPHYHSVIDFTEASNALRFETVIRLKFDRDEFASEVPLVFPIEALRNKNSFYRQELLTDQKIKLHFSNENEYTHYQSIEIQANGISVDYRIDSINPEVFWISLHNCDSDSLFIHVKGNVHLGDARIFPSGMLDNKLIFQHILPYIPPYIESAWSITPLNSRGNYHREAQVHKLTISVPASFGVVGNAEVENTHPGVFELDVHAQEVYLVIGENVSFDEFSKNDQSWQSFTWDKMYPSPMFLHSFKKDLEKYVSIYLNETNPPNFTVISLPISPEYYDFGNHVILLPSDKVEGVSWVSYFTNILKYNTSKEAVYAQIYFNTLVKSSRSLNFFNNPWAGDGLARFLRDDFLNKGPNPPKLSGRLHGTLISKIMYIDDIPLTYQNHLLYYYLARQGLDQPIASSTADFTALNYQSILQAKTSIALQHLQAFLKPLDFYRGLETIYHAEDNTPIDSVWANAFVSRKPTDWFFDYYMHSNKSMDYRISKIQKCNSIYAVTVKNQGSAPLPFPISGIKDGEEHISIWYPGHLGKRSLGFHHDNYDYIVIDNDNITQDINPRNNRRIERNVLSAKKPIRFQLYTGIEDPKYEQIFVAPSGGFNAYDGVHAGLAFFNNTIIPKKYEYRLEPNISSGIANFEEPFSDGGLWRVTGRASFVYNHRPESGVFHRVTTGFFGSTYHYDDNLRFFRYSPFVRFWWKKSHPRNPHIHRSRIRLLALERQKAVDFGASYQLLQFTHDYENTNILRPCSLRAQAEISENFIKLQAEFDQRWMLRNKKWMSIRAFTGLFAYNNLPQDFDFFNFGLSGTQDYAFDYYLFGRSETSGLWSQQLIVSDGGFKTQTNVFASSWMTSMNTFVPIVGPLGVFGDIGWADSFKSTYWGYGLRLALLTDFLEIYFPIQNQNQFLWENAYPREIRFIANLDLNTIIQRVRRGLY